VGDLCENDPRSFFKPAGYPFYVQRSWSNLAALGQHDPCVPALDSSVYFNTMPELPDSVGTNFTVEDTKGVKIPVGGTRTIMVQLYADGPTDAWTLSARDASGESPHLTFTFEKTTGKAGDRIGLTITKRSESDKLGAEPFQIISTSTSGKRTSSLGLVGH
jgi:hypothetical protein